MYLNRNCVDCKCSRNNSSDWFWSSVLAFGRCSTGMGSKSIFDDLVRCFDLLHICSASIMLPVRRSQYRDKKIFLDAVKDNLGGFQVKIYGAI
ncbi:Hypothetical predicted protein [Olea europaea subsp. europaea]|uniref:Uncharacterized protein n=1 Tax=Olea europaea subsp. europaea TaxID=158383 RepID=A0A8S0TUY5_OLEEU|nr:Hypothetical predicted protein [Olea europaea subsp. europaea]